MIKKNQHNCNSNIILKEHETYLEIDVSTPKFPNSIMLIDKKDWPLISRNNRVSVGSNGSNILYANCGVGNNRGRVHRKLFPNSDQVDHVNHNTLDNRRINLRPCTKNLVGAPCPR